MSDPANGTTPGVLLEAAPLEPSRVMQRLFLAGCALDGLLARSEEWDRAWLADQAQQIADAALARLEKVPLPIPQAMASLTVWQPIAGGGIWFATAGRGIFRDDSPAGALRALIEAEPVAGGGA